MVRFNVNGPGFKGATVPATEAGLVGFYGPDSKPYQPDRDAVRALLPWRWRKAFDAAGPLWWGRGYFEVTVKGRNGKFLTTVYAHPFEA